MAIITDQDVVEEFHHVVNLRADELDAWLQRAESQAVGQPTGVPDESSGHRAGRRILELLRREQYDEDDLAHMRTVIDAVHRQLGERPRGDVRDTAWRFSLMNWGRDPLRDEGA